MAVGTPANLTAGLDTTDNTSFVTAAFTPTAGAKLLAYVDVGHRTITPSFPTSLSGHSVTWTKVTDVTTSNNTWNCSLWEAVASGSPSSGTLTFNLGATAESCTWRVVESAGAQVVQSKTLATSVADPSLTLNSAIGAGGVTLGFLMNNNATTTLTAGSGYTDIGTQQSSGVAPVFKSAVEYNMTGTTTVAYTAAGTVVRGLIGLELGPAGATNVNGTASVSATDALTTAGAVGAVASGSIAATDALSGAGLVGKLAAATLAATVAITAAGVVGTSSGASITETSAITTAGVVGTSSGASIAATGTITAAGSLGVAGLSATASIAATDTITTAGQIGAAASASVAETAAITTAGVVGKAAGASVAETGALTAAGVVGKASTASVAATAALTATGVVGLSSGASLAATDAITATGVAGAAGAGSATVASTGTITATGSVGVVATTPVGARSTGRLIEPGTGHITTPVAHGRLLGEHAARFLTGALEGDIL